MKLIIDIDVSPEEFKKIQVFNIKMMNNKITHKVYEAVQRGIDVDVLKAKINHELDMYRYTSPIYVEQVTTNRMIDIFISILAEAIEDLEQGQ